MLPREKGGVVDPQLKVYGTKNVRVVDLSIVPLHFASHSQGRLQFAPYSWLKPILSYSDCVCDC